jgi:hypothetical protein
MSILLGRLSSAVMGLGVHTTAVWGDVTRNFACPHGEPDGRVDFIPDVISVSDKFSNVNCPVPKGRADLQPTVPDLLINSSDVLACLDAFSGVPYPFAMGASCPLTVQSPAA